MFKSIQPKKKEPELKNSQASGFFENTKLALLSLLAISAPLFFWQMGAWQFFDPDEGRYAEIPREMLARGDWITPFLNFTPYYEKPPLLYWSVAASFGAFGLHEWAARLTPALAALTGVLLVYMLGDRMFNARAGFLGAVVLATSLLYSFMAHELVIDMLFSVMLFAALALWWMGHSEENSKRRFWYFMLFWSTLALAMLAKGPVAVLLAFTVIGCYFVMCRPKAALRAMHWLPGMVLFAVIAAPWYILVAQRNPAFNHFFWYGQHIGRFLGKGENREHAQGFSYFVKLLPLLFFPWSFFVPAAVIFGWKKLWPARRPSQRAVVYLLAMSTLILLFFSASSSKLVPYILPIFPPMALVMGFYFDRLIATRLGALQKSFVAGIAVLAVALGTLALVMFLVAPKYLLRLEGLPAGWAIAEGLLLSVWLGALLVTLRTRDVGKIVAAVAGGFTVFFAGTMPLVAAAAPNHMVAPLLTYIQPGLDAGGEIIIDKVLTQSVSFYARRRVAIVGDGGETGFGASLLPKAERDRWFLKDHDALNKAMQSSKPVYCVLPDPNPRKIAKVLVVMPSGAKLIVKNKRRAIIGNSAAVVLTPPVPGGLIGARGNQS